MALGDNINTINDLLDVAERELGRLSRDDCIDFFMKNRREFFRNNPYPDIKDLDASLSYRRKAFDYAAAKTVDWIEEQSYARRTHPDGFVSL